jgi:DNA (cytosine-5)-methyltransferase 1
MGVVQPFVLATGSSGAPRSTDEPLPTITTGGAGNVDDPGCARPMVVQPFVLSQASGGAPREVQEPLPTVPGGGAHALIAPYYGSGSGETCRSVSDPLPTATAKHRFGLVMPVTHSDGSNRARSLDQPIPTLTTAKRGELAFITASFGERPTQAPRVHSVDDPAPTICATGRVNLVTAQPQRPYDILFRMLEPHELAAAMSISSPERPYRFVGNKTEVVRQIGQAVPRKTGRALVHALMGAEG